MPQKSQDNMKATSPSKLVQQGVDKSWGQQQQNTTTAQAAIAQQHNRNPVSIPKK